MAKKRKFRQISISLAEFSYVCHLKYAFMKKRVFVLVAFLSLLLCLGSCASNKGSRAMRKAERQMEKVEKTSDKQFKQAKSAHYKHQANKTKKMMKKDARRARRMRNHQRSNPFF